MLFNKKPKDKEDKCIGCGKKSNIRYDFCPHCGESKIDETKEAEDFGLLGKSDTLNMNPLADAGIFEKIIGTLMQTAVKTMVSEMKSGNENPPEIKQMPNGIKITLGQQAEKKDKRAKEHKITDEQITRMSGLPRSAAKTNIRRFNDKIVYELSATRVSSLNDIFISKVESGYEIKMIGKNKVYVNSIPVNFPLMRYGITENAIILEFASNQQ